MKVTVWKKDGESNERAIARFNKLVQASRKLLLVREKRYHIPTITKREIRAAALVRSSYRAAKEKSKFY